MPTLTRRQALVQLSLGTAGLLLYKPHLFARDAPSTDLSELADRIRSTPRERIFDLAAEVAGKGVDNRAILAASFLAGIHDVRPRHVGGKLHCVMMIESAFTLSEGAAASDAWPLALWALDDFKRSQARDRRDGDWELPPRPEVSFSSAAKARNEFEAAMESWDDERADRAIVGLLQFRNDADLFEILWRYGARSFVDIGHKIIFTTQIERTLRRIGREHAEPALRSLVYGLLHAETIDEKQVEAYDSSVELAAQLPDTWLKGKEDPAHSAVLLRKLRTASMRSAQQLVIEAFQDGLGPGTVWDGLRLTAAELFLRRLRSAPARHRAALLPVHAVTVTESFGYAWATARSEKTKRLMLLQAAGWLSQLREGLDVRNTIDLDRPGLDALNAEARPLSLEALLEDPTPERALSYLEADPTHAGVYLHHLRAHLARTGEEHHQHKYAAALLLESQRAHARWRPRILATAVPYLHNPGAADSDVLGRSQSLMRGLAN